VPRCGVGRLSTDTDLRSLEVVFLESGFGSQVEVDLHAHEHHGLGLFLRSLTGLDREAANDALGQFLAGKTFNAHQLHFLNLLVDVLAKNGTIDVAGLYELPFTARASGGPEDLFTESEVDAIVTVLSEVKATAVPISVAAWRYSHEAHSG
jgi:type I restriction enzyme, R subunit